MKLTFAIFITVMCLLNAAAFAHDYCNKANEIMLLKEEVKGVICQPGVVRFYKDGKIEVCGTVTWTKKLGELGLPDCMEGKCEPPKSMEDDNVNVNENNGTINSSTAAPEEPKP
jgi:hypothetical protein